MAFFTNHADFSPGEKIMLAEKLSDASLKQARVIEARKLEKVESSEMGKIKLKHPFNNLDDSRGFWNYEVPLIESTFVTEETGTGFVHMAPSHGAEDYDEFVKMMLKY